MGAGAYQVRCAETERVFCILISSLPIRSEAK